MCFLLSCFSSTQHEVQGMYEDAFLRFGRLSHLIQCLGHHPQYLSHFILTLDFVMHGNGPLRLDIRNYIAVLVSVGDTSQC